MKTKTIILSLALAVMAQITKAQHFGWAKQLGGTNDEYAYSIAIDAAGNLYSIGAFQGTTDFDTGGGTFNLTSAGDYDIYL
ncbi:MAG: SBBP repeat-containing protein, partial [Bacteroidia bacterium]|nr:SBBP repeat-containing protein [Bacteroidia bacterium]